jgi:hypothetical protein
MLSKDEMQMIRFLALDLANADKYGIDQWLLWLFINELVHEQIGE